MLEFRLRPPSIRNYNIIRSHLAIPENSFGRLDYAVQEGISDQPLRGTYRVHNERGTIMDDYLFLRGPLAVLALPAMPEVPSAS